MPDERLTHWFSVIAKSLAYLCLQQGKFPGKTEQALFLEGVGLTTAEQAAMLDSTPASIAELKRQKKNKGGPGAKKAARRNGQRAKRG